EMRRRIHDVLVRAVLDMRRGLRPRRSGRIAVQQQERRAEKRTANVCGNAEAPPPSALVPQGSTLLRGHSAPAPTHGWRGVSKKLDNHSRAAQTGKVEERFVPLFPQVTGGTACDISVNPQLSAYFWPISSQKFLVRWFSYFAQKQVN
ncbi:MAG TPA: hypothetical protein VH137_00165, partial [Gemmatimonadales bacterium]|nr:hypothetical protein [Gemmatimonadales bacterium]